MKITQSNYQYRIKSDVSVSISSGFPIRIIRVQKRQLGVWIDIKTYTIHSSDMADHDYALIRANELLEELKANDSL